MSAQPAFCYPNSSQLRVGPTWSRQLTAAAAVYASMYASANSMVRTANGALVIGGRFPLMSLQVSWDDGHSWSFYSLESRPGGNGAMVEVAPNVVMCTAPSHIVLCRHVMFAR